ncbi:MAG: tagaturonate reductase [Bacteroidota bacterium]
MKDLNNKEIRDRRKNPVKIVQFGEGNFLRAFVDWMFDKLNEQGKFVGDITLVQPIENGLAEMINAQDGLYHVFTKGLDKGTFVEETRLIKSVNKCINPYSDFAEFSELAETETLELVISNTTEAGIQYLEEEFSNDKIAKSYPGKLTQLLYKRFVKFNGNTSKGLTILPVELINNNGGELKSCVLKYVDSWKLGEEFRNWILNANYFHNTLVDRIVTGYPKDTITDYQNEVGYKDNLVVTAEHYHLWVIEGANNKKLNEIFENSGLNVLLVDDLQPYRTRKVRVLNGAHTSMVPVGLLNGNVTVQQTVEETFTAKFVKNVIENEISSILDFPEDEIKEYADEIVNRFKNPAVKHQLASIALNSIAKFKVRVLPSLLDYKNKFGELPLNLTFSLASLIVFYKGNGMPINDDKEVMDFFADAWSKYSIEDLVTNVLSNESFWGEDLTEVKGLSENLIQAIKLIESKGVEVAWTEFIN